MNKLKVKSEGRKNIYLPEKAGLKTFIRARKLKNIHHFFGSPGPFIIGANHTLASVIKDIDKADRIAIFTDITMNMGHSMAIIIDEVLNAFDIGSISKEELEIKE